jgi:Asp-tRNA(Asn)/Glu-tRNA(Gln) amidotransferase C subunit
MLIKRELLNASIDFTKNEKQFKQEDFNPVLHKIEDVEEFYTEHVDRFESKANSRHRNL